MASVLIAGCGYVGSAAAKLFIAKGWDIVAWTKSGQFREKLETISTRAVDLRDETDVKRNSFQCDVVVHCASTRGGEVDQYRRLYHHGVHNLASSFPQSRLVFTSSTSVYAQRDGHWVDEDSPAEPITESSRILREAEEVVLERGGSVLRLGGIYGPGRSFFLRSLSDGNAALSISDRYVNQIHREDAAAAILFVAEHREIMSRRIFNVVDDEPVRRNELLLWLAAQLQVELAPTAKVPLRTRADSNKRVSNARLRTLGWAPRYRTYREGFLNSVLPAANVV